MKLSIIESSTGLSHTQLSPGDLSSQTKLPFYHQSHPPVSWELQQQLRKWQPELLGHGLGIICTTRACDPQWLSPTPVSAVELLCALLQTFSMVLCTGVLLCSVEGLNSLRSKEGTCKVKAPRVSNKKNTNLPQYRSESRKPLPYPKLEKNLNFTFILYIMFAYKSLRSQALNWVGDFFSHTVLSIWVKIKYFKSTWKKHLKDQTDITVCGTSELIKVYKTFWDLERCATSSQKVLLMCHMQSN